MLFEDRSGALWIGTSTSGLFRYDGTNITRAETSHQSILSLTEDREGNIWAGTAGGGLNRLRPRVLEVEGKAAGLPFEAVRSACEDASGGALGNRGERAAGPPAGGSMENGFDQRRLVRRASHVCRQ